MNKFIHSVQLDEEACTGCINCIKYCPTQAIRVHNGKASITPEFCIDCGRCLRYCPHHAQTVSYDSIRDIRDYRYTVALPAPSLYAQFNNLKNIDIVLNALLSIGFNDVFEVSAAAELVSEASRAYIREHMEDAPFISTSCPAVIRLIRVKFPTLIPRLLPIKPPIEIAAEIARKRAVKKTGYAPEKIGIFFISPCPSKVAYVKSPLGIEKSSVDKVLAIKDVYPQLISHMKAVGEEAWDLVTSGKIGISWGRSGGEASGLFTESYLAADGIENVIRVLEDLEDWQRESIQELEKNGGAQGYLFRCLHCGRHLLQIDYD